MGALFYFALAFLFTLVLRRDWLGWVALVVFYEALCLVYANFPSFLTTACVFCFVALMWGLVAFIMARFGLLASVALLFTWYVLRHTLLTWDVSAWYFWPGLVAPAVLLTLAAYGYFTATAGQRLFAHGFFGDE
jgi:hypothetical protein